MVTTRKNNFSGILVHIYKSLSKKLCAASRYNSFRVSVVALESDFMRHLRAARNTVYRERCFFFFLRIAYLGYAFEEVIFIISVSSF